jgi:hypothetical protein
MFSTWYVGGEQSTSIEPVISPIILDVWAQNIADPFISIDAVEVLEVIYYQKLVVLLNMFHFSYSCKCDYSSWLNDPASYIDHMIIDVHHKTFEIWLLQFATEIRLADVMFSGKLEVSRPNMFKIAHGNSAKSDLLDEWFFLLLTFLLNF